MSGIFTSRTSIVWDIAIQADVSAAVFFYEWMHFVNDHLGLVWIGYGTDKVQTGTTVPAAWLSWDKASPVPWGDNSWFVFEAKNASEVLDASGSMPWQCKLQYTGVTAFDDCNVADVDYTKEGSTYAVNGRVSCMGGWNATLLDFVPAGGEDISDNNCWWGGTSAAGKHEIFNLEIIGDDDTIVWNGGGGVPPYTSKLRGGYLGMLNRRSPSITYPFFHMAGNLGDISTTGGQYYQNHKDWNGQWAHNVNVPWPNYSLWKDGTKITTHHQDTWYSPILPKISRQVESGEDVLLAMLVAQWQSPNKYAILGELRHLAVVGTDWGYHEVRGTDPQWLQFCILSSTVGGVAMRWTVGEVPIW